MKTFLEISISATPSQRELLVATMVELGFQGFLETDTDLVCYADKSRWKDGSYEAFLLQLKQVVYSISANAAITIRDVPEENWNEQWEKTIRPIEVGTRIAIQPSWEAYDNREERIVITIDPKMSFGTGYHETTRLVLRMIETYILPQARMLDVGTGTGILAIAAVKLGASSAIGVDNDEWSIDNAGENVLANHVGHQVTILNSELHTLPSASFDLIAANLTLHTNIGMLDEFKRLLDDRGILLLSGLLLHDRETMVQHLLQHQFEVATELIENEWIAIAARRKQ